MSTETRHEIDSAVLRELASGSILPIAPGERLWKLYFLRPASDGTQRIEHRIYTKLQTDGRIGLTSYSIRTTEDGQPIKSSLAVAADIPEATLNQLIWNVVRQSQIGPDELEIVDLSKFDSLDAQMAYLRDGALP